METVKEGVKSFIMESVIVAGVKWLIGLLNPASAFVKACMAIYDIVTFIINKGQQILEFVNAVLDSVLAIAQGNVVPEVRDKQEPGLEERILKAPSAAAAASLATGMEVVGTKSPPPSATTPPTTP